MKQAYTIIGLALVMLMAAGPLSAQELVLNGGVESWDDPQTPSNWTKAENISQEMTTVHSGTYAAAHQSSASGTQDFQQDVSGIIGGTNYTITYYFYDDDVAAKTRIWSYWLEGTTYLDDNEAELRPSVYSDNMAGWQTYSVSLTAPATADGFRFEVRVYHENNVTGGYVYYDDFSIMPAGVSPEPSNYPTNFSAQAAGGGIDLGWTDATGSQLPNAYIVLASTSDNIEAPVDGTPVDDDPDLTDGDGALNVAFGDEMCSFNNLQGNTTYYFKIYPYTNGGSNIDFKTDGTAPSASATTADVVTIEAENFDNSWGNWQTISVTGAEVWDRNNSYGINGTACARMSGYDGGAHQNEDWLISPAMNFDNYTGETLSFQNAKNYTGPDLQVMVSNDFDGQDPTTATWNVLNYTLSGGSWEWTPSGDIDISSVNGTAVYVGFKFTSTDQESATWEVDDIKITGAGPSSINDANGINATFSIFPNPASTLVNISTSSPHLLVMEIISLTGAVMTEKQEFRKNTVADVSSLPAGLYLIRFSNAEGDQRIEKLLIEK